MEERLALTALSLLIKLRDEFENTELRLFCSSYCKLSISSVNFDEIERNDLFLRVWSFELIIFLLHSSPWRLA